jgi:hypothetical protein
MKVFLSAWIWPAVGIDDEAVLYDYTRVIWLELVLKMCIDGNRIPSICEIGPALDNGGGSY